MLRLALACAAAACIVEARADDLSVETYRRGDEVSVYISVHLDVDPRVAWSVLTDYDRLSQFIPDMSSSRVVAREGGAVIVEQKGEFSFLFFRQPVHLRFSVVETPPARVIARGLGGSFREMEGRYELLPTPAGLNLQYTGRFLPAFSLPPLIGMTAFRQSVVAQFSALLAEMRRRNGAAPGSGGP